MGVPVALNICSSDGDILRAIPRWLARSRSLHDACIEVISSTRLGPGHPSKDLPRAKDIIRQAARLALQRVRDGSAIDLEQKIYWSLVLLRVARRPVSPSGTRAVRVYPKLEDFVCGSFVEVALLHNHLTELIIQRTSNLLNSESDTSSPDSGISHKANALSAWVSLWASKRRRICCLAVRGPDGVPATTPYDSACHLV